MRRPKLRHAKSEMRRSPSSVRRSAPGPQVVRVNGTEVLNLAHLRQLVSEPHAGSSGGSGQQATAGAARGGGFVRFELEDERVMVVDRCGVVPSVHRPTQPPPPCCCIPLHPHSLPLITLPSSNMTSSWTRAHHHSGTSRRRPKPASRPGEEAFIIETRISLSECLCPYLSPCAARYRISSMASADLLGSGNSSGQ